MKRAARPDVSVVINTNGRRASLARTLESLRFLDYDRFEVCVIYGPVQDGTREMLQQHGQSIKIMSCLEQNLSMSRNIGIEVAAGDVLAFIDDDGIPEPEWLSGVSAPFADSQVGASGGLIYNQTGYEIQHGFITCDRLGRAQLGHASPATDRNYPFSFEFPAVTGTNAVFRRQALIEIGGFDEEFEYYLDETDVCCRLIDAGWTIAQLPGAPVHHKFLPSHVRTRHWVTDPYPLIKNKVYFSLVHALPYRSMDQVLTDCIAFCQERRWEHERHVRMGHIPSYALDQFDLAAEAAWRQGLLRGLSPDRRRRTPASLAVAAPFRVFTPHRVEGKRRVLVFLSQDYPPAPMSGVARYTHDVARALAAVGHTIHVLTRSDNGLNTVDFEEGVWVHRLLALDTAITVPRTPPEIAGLTMAYAKEVERISRFQHIDVVEAPSWDVEGLGILLGHIAPVVVNIVTTLAVFLETHPELAGDQRWMASFGKPLLALETKLLLEADGIIAASRAIVVSVEQHYGITLAPDRIDYITHLSANLATMPRRCPATLPATPGRVPVLFVGRLEARKGIDTLLAAATKALRQDDRLEFWIAGDGTQLMSDGLTVEQAFQQTASGPIRNAVRFLGRVSDEELNWLLAECAVVAIPSRFESFGLVTIEAMMFGKPVIATNVGGLAELVEPERSGLLVPVGDVTALAGALIRLAGDAGLRNRLGAGGSALYHGQYDPSALAERRLAALARHIRTPLGAQQLSIPASAIKLGLPCHQLGWRITHEPIAFQAPATRLWIRAWTHEWSGIIELRLDGQRVEEIDLFAPEQAACTFAIVLPHTGLVQVYAAGRRNPRARGSEAILMTVQVPEAVCNVIQHPVEAA